MKRRRTLLLFIILSLLLLVFLLVFLLHFKLQRQPERKAEAAGPADPPTRQKLLLLRSPSPSEESFQQTIRQRLHGNQVRVCWFWFWF